MVDHALRLEVSNIRWGGQNPLKPSSMHEFLQGGFLANQMSPCYVLHGISFVWPEAKTKGFDYWVSCPALLSAP